MKPLIVPRPAGGWIVLIGGGEFSFGETREIDEFCLSLLKRNRSVVFVPTASGSAEYGLHLSAYFGSLQQDVAVTIVPVYRMRDARREKHCRTLAEAGMIYIGGGVTNSGAETLRDSPALEALREALAAGAVVVGIGAGAALLGGTTADHFRSGSEIAGLDVIPGAAIVTGYGGLEEEVALRRLMSLDEVRIGIGIPARTAVAINPRGVAQILGAGSIAVMRKPPPPADS